MGCTTEVGVKIDPRLTACVEIRGKAHHGISGVGNGLVNLETRHSPELLAVPVHRNISKELSAEGLADVPGMDTGTIS